jgi:hypothetical protein
MLLISPSQVLGVVDWQGWEFNPEPPENDNEKDA